MNLLTPDPFTMVQPDGAARVQAAQPETTVFGC
jgi:hypothetical protein